MIVTVDMIREGRKARTVTKTVWPWSCTATLEVAHLGWMYTLHPTHASHRWSRQTPQPFTPASGPEAGQGPASVLVTHIEKLFFSRHSTYRQPVLMSAPPVRTNIAEPIRGTQSVSATIVRLTGAQIVLRQRRSLVPVAVPLLLVHADTNRPDVDTHRGRRPLQPLPAPQKNR